MAFVTKYGTLWAQIPNSSGNVYWVAPSASYTVHGDAFSASDNNDGLSPDRAMLTIDAAVSACTADAGDVVVCLPGSHTLSASVAMDVAGVTLMGLPSGAGNYLKQKTSVTAPASDQGINVTAANCEIAYLNIIPATTDSGIDLTANADQLHIHHCSFDMATPAVNAATIGIDAIGAASNLLVDHCYFECDGAQGQAIVATATLDSVIEDCHFTCSAGTWAAVILTGAATDRLTIRRCTIQSSGTAVTTFVDGTGATLAAGVLIHDCRGGVGVAAIAKNFDAGEAELDLNYIATVGGGTGGTLYTATA